MSSDSIAAEDDRLDALMAGLLDGSLCQAFGVTDAHLNAALGAANARFMAGDMRAAFGIYRALIMFRPGSFVFQQGMANICLEEGEYEVALVAGAAMITIEPANPLGYYFSAAACVALGQPQEAREDIADALALAKDDDTEIRDACLALLARLQAT